MSNLIRGHREQSESGLKIVGAKVNLIENSVPLLVHMHFFHNQRTNWRLHSQENT